MIKRGVLIAVSALAVVGVAMLLSQLSWPEREVASEFKRRFPKDQFELRFEPQYSRGVVCGHYRPSSKRDSSSWRSFVYVSHYSAGSPPASLLTLDRDAAGRESLMRYGCQ